MSAPTKVEMLEEFAGQLGLTLEDWAELIASCLRAESNWSAELILELHKLGVEVTVK